MKILFIIIVQCIAINLFAQNSITNTKWQGHIQKPQSLDILLDFRRDSLIVSSTDGAELEVMFFSQSKDTLVLRKLNGQSPCDYTTEGIYHLEWTSNGDKLLLHLINDDCTARSKSITSSTAYFLVKD